MNIAIKPVDFDWKNPNYAAVFRDRLAKLARIREMPGCLPAFKEYYRENPADFINDWGVTYDPRNAEIGLPTLVPFVLFPRQREWVGWVMRHWREQTPGLCEKSRDMGVSWLAMALSCTLCLFFDGVAIGVGSRKSIYVDKIGEMKPLLPKARMFMENLPPEFRGDWEAWRDAPSMRITFPETGSIISGEGGDDIGRGDRASIYLVDESAYLERPELIEASLSQTTNCRVDMSSVNGMNNPFARKRHEGKVDVFIFDWHEDPRKDQAWYDKQCAELDPVVVAQEIDRDYSASVHGIVIPGAWVRAAIDALAKLGIAPTGAKTLALDVADEGADKNALCGATGVQIDFLEQWSGKGADLYATTEHVFEVCDERGYPGFRYDADGLGAGVRGDARLINEARKAGGGQPLRAEGFRGSEAVLDPEGVVEGTIGSPGDKGRLNKDYYANRKAQEWWGIRRLFRNTHRWVVEKVPCSPDDIISLDKNMPLLQHLVAELSQPTYSINKAGKILINKKPNGMPSPNLADSAMINRARGIAPMQFTPELANAIRRAGAMRRRQRY